MKKQRLFFVFKLSSKRIKKAKYNINLTIEQARKNGELISISQNQVINSILKLTDRNMSDEQLESLLQEKRSIKKGLSNDSKKLFEIEEQINSFLFIPELISVSMDKKKDYEQIINNGLVVNGKQYVRLLCGAGHSRRNTVIFCERDIKSVLEEMLNNGRKMQEMVLAKNNAYFALAYSGILPVSDPYFCVIPDLETVRKEPVEFVESNNEIITKEYDLAFNLFDGQGIISPRLAKLWSEELGLDYIPGAFIIRNSFLKGMVCVVDFHKFSDEIGKHIIQDAWGNPVNVRDMDLILTTSQFKGWNFYSSQREYVDNCKKNDFHFGISRVTPKDDKTSVFSNYQFLQVLDLDDNQISNLSKKTIEYLSGVSGRSIEYVLLYLLGQVSDRERSEDSYFKLNDLVTKSLILNNKLLLDPYIKNHLLHSLNRKIRESYIGNLLLDGNYSMVVQDPYAFMEYMFGLEVNGLLKRGEHYSGFWNERGVSRVVSMRSPLTWKSESNILNLQNGKDVSYWYQYLNTGVVVYNIHGCDMMIHADGDSDGDLVMTTNQQEFIDGSFTGLPITYEKKKADKKEVVESSLWETDMLSFDSKIGYITNCSTSMYAMLPEYAENSEQYKELLRRLKVCRKLQGNQIDLAKGISIDPFPGHWTNWNKVDKQAPVKNQERAKFNNSILIRQRPYFMKYLYPHYAKKYSKYNASYENFCTTTFGKTLAEVLENPVTEKESETKKKYLEYSPLLDSSCVMNKICHHMEKSIQEIKHDFGMKANLETIALLKNPYFVPSAEQIKKMETLYKKYKSEKRNFLNIKNANGEEIYKTLEQYCKYIRSKAYEITTDISQLAHLAVIIVYEAYPNDNKSFAWSVFGEGLLQNVERNKQDVCYMPFRDENGNIEFLGKRYSMQEIKTKEDFDDLSIYNF